jgi:hypothetical protein
MQINPLEPEELEILKDALESMESLEFLNLKGIQINNEVMTTPFESPI